MTFNDQGFLIPSGPNNISIKELDFLFTDSQFENSETRPILKENLAIYLRKISTVHLANFTLWIDGSFVSVKLNPNDIDAVLEINWSQNLSFEITRNQTIWKYLVAFSKANKSGSFQEFKIDAYLLIQYPEGHSRRKLFTMEKEYWENWFSNDDRSKAKKGFIKIEMANL